MTLLIFAAAWVMGVIAADAGRLPAGLWLVGVPLALIGLVVVGRKRDVFHNIYAGQVACGAVLMFSLGGARMAAAHQPITPERLAYFNGQGSVQISGWISAPPEVRDTDTRLHIQAYYVRAGDGPWQPIEGQALVYTARGGTFRYGDQVRISGQLEAPPEFENFSYRDYLARRGINSLVRFARVEVSGQAAGPLQIGLRGLYSFRSQAEANIRQMLPDPQSGLLAGILLGVETYISDEVREAFARTGAAHVIAISGANMAVLGGLVQAVAGQFLPPRLTRPLIALVIIAYTIFVGAGASVVRAAIMVLIGLWALAGGKTEHGLSALAGTALLMLAFNPQYLWDVGFQLSFLATLGLILYVRPMQAWLGRLLSAGAGAETSQRVVNALSEGLLVTVAAQITTAPILAYTFGTFSLASLPVNLLIVPLQPPIMVLGGAGVVLSLVVYPLGQALTWGAWLFLSLTTGVVSFFNRLPFAEVEVPLSAAGVAAIYALIFGLTAVLAGEGKRTRLLARVRQAALIKVMVAAGGLACALLLVAAAGLPDGRLHVTVFPTGAALIETPSGRAVLIDAGPGGSGLRDDLGQALPFWQRRLDVAVLSRPAEAQIGGLLPALARYDVEAVLNNGIYPPQVADLWAALREQGAASVVAQPGMRIRIDDGAWLEVLHTQTRPLPEGELGAPVTVMLDYGQASFLFGASLGEDTAAELLRQAGPSRAVVLIVPGTEAVNTPQMLSASSPQVIVLAPAQPAPNPELVAQLGASARLYRTDVLGQVRITSDGARLWISPESPAR